MYINKKQLDSLLDTTALLKLIKKYNAIEKDNKLLDYGVTMTHLNKNLKELNNICITEINKRNEYNKTAWNRIKAKREIDPTYARSYIQKENMKKRRIK